MTVLEHDPRRRGRLSSRWTLPVLPLLLALAFLAGVCTALYPTVAGWFSQERQSDLLEQYADLVHEAPSGERALVVQRAHEYNAALTGGGRVGSFRRLPESDGAQGAVPGYAEQLAGGATGVMARLRIPDIEVDLPIHHGTSDAVLLRGVGHLEGTALPVGGAGTHTVLTAHRGLAEAALFTRLDEIAVGDTFTVEVFGQVLVYRVRQTQVVEPGDTQTLFPVPGQDLATLVTCTPLGINTQRILVTGQRVLPTPAESLDSAGESPDIPGFPWWIVILGGTVLVLGLYVHRMGRPRTPRSAVSSP